MTHKVHTFKGEKNKTNQSNKTFTKKAILNLSESMTETFFHVFNVYAFEQTILRLIYANTDLLGTFTISIYCVLVIKYKSCYFLYKHT